MARIDKTYCNKKQYLDVIRFWLNTKDEQISIFGSPIWMYIFNHSANNSEIVTSDIDEEYINNCLGYFDSDDKQYSDYCVWNTSSMFDLWLSVRCELDFVQDRLHEQYPDDWLGFNQYFKDNVDFTEKCRIYEILKDDDDDKCNLYFYKNTEEEGVIETIDEILAYGDTNILKVIHTAKRQLNGFTTGENYTIHYSIFGVIIQMENLIEKVKDENDIEYVISTGYMPISSDLWDLPSVKLSFDLNDFDNYDKEDIYISMENNVYPLTDYKNYETLNKNRFVLQLPVYISEYIK